MSEPDYFIDILNGIDIKKGVITANLAPKMITLKTSQGYFTINSNIIKAINWGINLGERFVIRLFCNDGFEVDLDYIDPDNQIFLTSLIGPHWKKYLHTTHQARYSEWLADQPNDD